MSSTPADSALASRIAGAVQALAQVEVTGHASSAELSKLLVRAAERLDCGYRPGDERMVRRRSRWRPLMRRALAGAGAAHARLISPLELQNPWLVDELSEFGPDMRSTVAIAESIVNAEPAGMRSILVLGNAAPVAAALSRLTHQRVFLVPWSDDSLDEEPVLAEPLGFDVALQESMGPGHALPFWLKDRFQSVVLQTPLDPVASHKSVSMAIKGLDRAPGLRLYWTGHPARHAAYFDLLRLLGGHGLFLERLVPGLAATPLDPDFAHQLLEDLLETPEVAEALDALVLEDLLSARAEYEHLHVMCRIEEFVLRGHQLELVPVKPQDIQLYDSWLTPEYCAEIGLVDDEPRPSVEQLRVSHWYPDHEWWMFRTREGVPIGTVHLVLYDFWTLGKISFDIGVAEHSYRGKGLLNEAVRLTFARVFDRLAAHRLCAFVAMSNVRIRRGYVSNFFQTVEVINHAKTGEEWEYIEVKAEAYRSLRQSGAIDVPLDG